MTFKELTFQELREAFLQQPYVQDVYHYANKKHKKGDLKFKRNGEPALVAKGRPVVPKEVDCRLQELLADPKVIAIALYRNVTMDSSALGQCSALPVGDKADLSVKRVDDLPPWLNDLPSQRQHLQGVFRKTAELLADNDQVDEVGAEDGYRCLSYDEAVSAARNTYTDDDIEIDDNPKTSRTDNGCWVQAWLWVPYPQLDEEE